MRARILRIESGVEGQPVAWEQLGAGAGVAAAQGSERRAAAVEPEVRAEVEARHRREVAAAREEGLRAGEAAGRQKALAEAEGVMRKLARSIEEVASHKARQRQQAERDVVWLAMEVARRILRREIRVDEEAVLGLVKAALENANLREVTEVRVHPSHKSKFQEYVAEIGAPVAITVRADATLEPGGVVVETSRGTLDASLETQLEEIGRGLVEAAPGRRG